MRQFLVSEKCLEFCNRILRFKIVEAKSRIEKQFAEHLCSQGILCREGSKMYKLLPQEVPAIDSLRDKFQLLDVSLLPLGEGVYSERTISALLNNNSKRRLTSGDKSKLKSIGIHVKEDGEIFLRSGGGCSLNGEAIPFQPKCYYVFPSISIPDVCGATKITSIENKAYFQDYTPVKGELVILTPGMNLSPLLNIGRFLDFKLIEHVPDLDYRGMEISVAILKWLKGASVRVPKSLDKLLPYLQDVNARDSKKQWQDIEGFAYPTSILQLVSLNKWVEQEVFILLEDDDFELIRLSSRDS